MYVYCIVPINMYNTMNSPEFSTYMGIGKSDMRIDLRRTDSITEDSKKLQEELKNDREIEKPAAYITSSYQVKNVKVPGTISILKPGIIPYFHEIIWKRKCSGS